jgi:hypothetical protein
VPDDWAALRRELRDELRAELRDVRVELREVAELPAEVRHLTAAVARIDGWLTWVQRIVIGTVLAALLALVVYSGGNAV